MADTFALSCFEFKAMGSPCALRLYAENAEIAAKAVCAAVSEIQRLENKYSRYKTGNFLHKVNQAAANGESIQVDDEFLSLLNYANTCYQQSDGLFDITSGVLRKAWNFNQPQAPDPTLISRLQECIGWQYIQCNTKHVSFLKPGMELDLGGIVKEYAADRAAAICKENGIRYGLVDMGGDMHIIGPHPDGKPWIINIRHPRNTSTHTATHFASFHISQGALASSGDYERNIIIDNKRYSHILSPKTGWPVHGLSAVSVLAPQCVLAGSACTIAMLKEFAGTAWLDELGLDYAAMDVNGRAYGSASTCAA